MNNHKYLGDGVYANYDGYHVELRTGSHKSDVLVFLDPEVAQSLVEYIQNTQILSKQKDEPEEQTGE